jgi:hypothetical protein
MVDRGFAPHQRPSAGPASTPVAFLSYAHAETELALQFRDALASRGLRVLIDVDDLKPGEGISEFARRSVKTADATICLISTASLSSAWVVFEAVTTLHKEQIDPAARLIACATDQAFFHPEFRLHVTKLLDERLATIDRALIQYLSQQLDMNDLAADRSQLLRMRANLGDVLERLRGSLTLALGADNVVASATKVADHIRELFGQPPSRTDPRDIRERAEELRRHLWDGRMDDALDRFLDFVQEFSNAPKHKRDATLVANTLRRIEMAERDQGLSFGVAEKQRQPMISRFLELIDEIETHPELPVVPA